MNERRRFGRLELIFALIAAAYVGLVIYNGRSNDGDGGVVAEAAATVVVLPTIVPEPTEAPLNGVADRLSELETNEPVTSAQSMLERGDLYVEAGDLSAALADYTSAIDMQPDSRTRAELYLRRGGIYQNLRLYDEALADYANAREYGDENQSAAALVGRGDVFRARGETDAAMSAYNQVIENGAAYAPAYNARGLLALEQGDIATALSDFGLAMENDPDNLDYVVNLGLAAEADGDTGLAVASYGIVLNQDPTRTDALLGRASILSDQGDYQTALADFSQAIRLGGADAVVLNDRGYAYAQMEELDRAIADYTASLALDPTNPTTLLNRGTAYYDLGQYLTAIEDLTAAIESDPENAVAYNNRALAYERVGDVGAALADYDASMALQPEEEWGVELYNRGVLYYREERYAEAEADLIVAVDLLESPADAETWAILGDLYLVQERPADALDAYQRHILLSEIGGATPRITAVNYVEANAQPPPPNLVDALATLSAPTPAGQVVSRSRLGIVVQAMIMRDSPSITANDVIPIVLGDRVEILDEADNFYQVRYMNQIGWVLQDTIELIDTEPAFGLMATSLNLRDRPDLSGDRLTFLDTETMVSILGTDVTSTWVYVQVDDVFGWLPIFSVETTADPALLPLVEVSATPAP